MKTQRLDIKTADGVSDSFFVCPDGDGSYPAVLFYTDAFGPRAYTYEMAQTLAEKGFCVLLPNILYRARRAPLLDVKYPIDKKDIANVFPLLRPLMQTFTPELGLSDVPFYLDFLNSQEKVRPGPIAVTGYCMGGGFAIRTAARFADRVSAAASFHASGLVTDAMDSPHRLLGQIKAKLYFGHSEADLAPPQLAIFEEFLAATSLRYESEVYAAAHGFTMKDLPAYNEAALKKHWTKLSALLERAFARSP